MTFDRRQVSNLKSHQTHTQATDTRLQNT